MKRLRRCRRFGKSVFPAAVEVQGIDQHEARARMEGAWAKQILDTVVGLLRDPSIAELVHSVGVLAEISESDVSVVVTRKRVEKRRHHVHACLRPQVIGYAQLQMMLAPPARIGRHVARSEPELQAVP